MSHENVEIVQRMLSLFSAVDPEVFELFDPEVEMHDYPGVPDRQWHHGPKGVIAFAMKHREVYNDIRVVASEFVEAPDGTLAARVDVTASGKRSGIPIAETIYGTFALRDGKVLRIDTFATQAEAFEAAGMS